jgi:hypothetical protein
MGYELENFLTRVMTSKRTLKEVYYTTRDSETKFDAKELVVATISLQKTLEDLLKMKRKVRAARKVLEDRKAVLSLSKWTKGLTRRVDSYTKKKGKFKQDHLHKYQDSLLEYIEKINEELAKWVIDIETLSEIPRLPKK